MRGTPRSLGAVVAGIIDPRPTEYHGIPMRSRLEAAFARHLDEMGVIWRYESAVFGPEGQGYLPDFEVARPDGRHFIEVKPRLSEVPLAKQRMTVIWRNYPEAVLVVACAEECRWYACVLGGQWETWVDRWSPL